MTEHELQNSIIEHFAFHRWPYARINTGSWQSAATGSWIHGDKRAGHPDLVVGRPENGIFVWAYIECKSMTGKLSADQISFLRAIHKLGIPWLVCRSMIDLDKWLVDKNYHGMEKDADAVLNENKKFVPSEIRKTQQKKLTMSTFLEHDRWSDKHDA